MAGSVTNTIYALAYEGAFFGTVRGQLAYASCLATHRVGYTDAHGSWVSA